MTLPGKPKGPELLRISASYLELGLRLAVIILLALWAGHKADKHWGTHPWLMIAGLLVGAVVGFYWFIMTIRDLEYKQKEKDDQ